MKIDDLEDMVEATAAKFIKDTKAPKLTHGHIRSTFDRFGKEIAFSLMEELLKVGEETTAEFRKELEQMKKEAKL